MTLHHPIARRTIYRGVPMRSRTEARAAQILDSMPGVTWVYEPCAYGDETGQVLPDFEAMGILDAPLILDIKGAATPAVLASTLLALRRVWSSLPDAGLAIWTGDVLDGAAPFTIHRRGQPTVSRILRTCSICGHAYLIDDDWAATFAPGVCASCLVA